MKDEALKLALEALEGNTTNPVIDPDQAAIEDQAITAINQALAAQPVQERTDYEVHLNHCNLGECEGVCKYLDDDCPALKHADMKAKWDRPTPPAAQRQWTGLTDDEVEECVKCCRSADGLARAIEAKLKEKNAAAHPAVPDAMTSADIQEHIEYVAGWNDCRQAMLEMMK
jgi:hypothetical protein